MSNPFARARMNMVDAQVRSLPLANETIPAAFASLPREDFTTPHLRGIAYCDDSVEMADGRFLLAPHLMARMADAAGISHTSCVLDIGCGSGYSTALLSRMAGCVIGIEADPALAHAAEQALARLAIDNAAVINAPAGSGFPQEAPFDAILITGGQIDTLPASITEQLAPGGRIVYISGETLEKMTRTGSCLEKASLGRAIAPAFSIFPDAATNATTPETSS